jgi:hypothetical protein
MVKQSPVATGEHRLNPPAVVLRKEPKVKKGQKRCPQGVIVTTSYNENDREADGSDEEYVVAIELDFKC